MRHLISPLDFSVEELDKLLTLANDIEKNPEKYSEACKGKKLATLFYEPSTRTRLSFEAAMMNLGGNVLGFSEATSSSAAKGESVADTIQIISCYADIAAMRHPKEGAALVAANNSAIPVINAGDGGHQHPTQTSSANTSQCSANHSGRAKTYRGLKATASSSTHLVPSATKRPLRRRPFTSSSESNSLRRRFVS